MAGVVYLLGSSLSTGARLTSDKMTCVRRYWQNSTIVNLDNLTGFTHDRPDVEPEVGVLSLLSSVDGDDVEFVLCDDAPLSKLSYVAVNYLLNKGSLVSALYGNSVQEVIRVEKLPASTDKEFGYTVEI